MNIITYALEKKIPIAVQLNLTRQCNLQCIHCCVGKRNNGNGKNTHGPDSELTLPEIQKVLEQLAEAGCLLLTLSGGEVLFRKDLLDIIAYARRLNFAVKVFTNGTLLGKKEAEAFRKLHLQEVHISLYAAQAQVHDLISGVSGSWQKSMEGIRRLRQEGVAVKIKCAIMRQNLAEYRKVYDLALSLGADYAFDPIITARDDGSCDTLKLRIEQEDLRKVLYDPIFQSKKEKIGENANSACSLGAVSEEITCSAGHYICFISPEGDVTPCVQLPIRCGNVRTYDFNWIWRHSPEMLKIRQLRMKDIRGCNECRHLPWCARCPGLAYLEDGDLLGPSSAACWMAEAREQDVHINLAS
jgi:radical SAM protein with 4Fe4S-binding SPASM domain